MNLRVLALGASLVSLGVACGPEPTGGTGGGAATGGSGGAATTGGGDGTTGGGNATTGGGTATTGGGTATTGGGTATTGGGTAMTGGGTATTGGGSATTGGGTAATGGGTATTGGGDGVDAGEVDAGEVDAGEVDAGEPFDAGLNNTGESCADPLVMAQATVSGGLSTWVIPAGGVATTDTTMGCDPNGIGPDVVIEYVKTTDTLANGGDLLHVRALPSTTSTAQYLDVSVLSGGCDSASASSLKCLWYKHDWDVFLDVPAGTYYVWVAKNSAATATVLFPETTVSIEEVPALAAEGEGCFAPYTVASANYTAPASSTDPHTWVLPASINSFDMAPQWGEPGSISCDNTASYGDITGVDAVVEFEKTSASSVLLVNVQNLANPLSASDLDVEVLNVCDPLSTAKVSLACEANADTLTRTVGGPAGNVYIWVTTEATGEEFAGAQVQVTEIYPGPGESAQTAVELLSSGPVSPSSNWRLDAPSCFPSTGNVYWYKYVVQNGAFSLQTDVAGTIAVLTSSLDELACVADASTAPFSGVYLPGTVLYLALPVGGTVGAVTISDTAYDGVSSANLVDLEVTWPVSATIDYGMAAGNGQLFMGGTSQIFSWPFGIGANATEHAAADGLTATQLGYDLVFAGGSLFSVDSTTSTTASRVFRVYDGTTWGPTTWDLSPSYPSTSTPSYALATDGASLLLSTRATSAAAGVSFYAFPLTAPASPTFLGSNTGVWYVVGFAADDTYLYVASNGASGEGIYRLSRASLTDPPVLLASLDTTTLANRIALSSLSAPAYLYARANGGDIHVIRNPGGAAEHLGVIATLGTTSDYAMTYDTSTDTLYFFETETQSTGRVWMMW